MEFRTSGSMCVFSGDTFTIYSGSHGDVIVKDGAVWVGMVGQDEIRFPDVFLDYALYLIV